MKRVSLFSFPSRPKRRHGLNSHCQGLCLQHPASHHIPPAASCCPMGMASVSPPPWTTSPRTASLHRQPCSQAGHRGGILAEASNPPPQGGPLGPACYSRQKVVNNLPGAGDRGKPQRCHVLAPAGVITGQKQHRAAEAALEKQKAKVQNAAPTRRE